MPIEGTRKALVAHLRDPGLLAVADAFRESAVDVDQSVAMVYRVDKPASTRAPVEALKAMVGPQLADPRGGSFEKFVLVHTALQTLESIHSLPVSDSVKGSFCEVFRKLTEPVSLRPRWFAVEHAHFTIACKVVSLRRFPAGEFDWEVSGLPRSWLLKIEKRALPKAAYVIVAKLGGFGPAFFGHLGIARETGSLSEQEHDRSMYRMAKSLSLQPGIKGFLGSSWIRSPDTHRVSPRLAWMGEFYRRNGGFMTRMGPADPSGGVLGRSATRRRLYESGAFKPTIGLVIWPRREMLAWAEAHPELAD